MINGVLGEGHVKLWARSPQYDVYSGWVLMITSCVPIAYLFFSLRLPRQVEGNVKELARLFG